MQVGYAISEVGYDIGITQQKEKVCHTKCHFVPFSASISAMTLQFHVATTVYNLYLAGVQFGGYLAKSIWQSFILALASLTSSLLLTALQCSLLLADTITGGCKATPPNQKFKVTAKYKSYIRYVLFSRVQNLDNFVVSHIAVYLNENTNYNDLTVYYHHLNLIYINGILCSYLGETL